MVAARAILGIAAVYGSIGIIFALVFVVWGVVALDPAARGAGLRFRVLIFPGSAALWPILLVKWIRRPL